MMTVEKPRIKYYRLLFVLNKGFLEYSLPVMTANLNIKLSPVKKLIINALYSQHAK